MDKKISADEALDCLKQLMSLATRQDILDMLYDVRTHIIQQDAKLREVGKIVDDLDAIRNAFLKTSTGVSQDVLNMEEEETYNTVQ